MEKDPRTLERCLDALPGRLGGAVTATLLLLLANAGCGPLPGTRTPAPPPPTAVGDPGPLPPWSSRPQPPTPPATRPVPPSTVPSDMETQALALANQARAQAGLEQLRLNRNLQAMARLYSETMARSGTLSHDLGGGFQKRVGSSGVKWLQAGENIAEGYATAQSVFDGWMNSAGHRANILGQRYTATGLGLFRDPQGTFWWAQEFVQEAPAYLAQPVPDRPEDFLHLPPGLKAPADAKGEEDSPWEEPASAPVEWVVQPRPGIRNPNPSPWPSPGQIHRIRNRHGR